MKPTKLKTIIGIDQTGACKKNGEEAKALPVVLGFKKNHQWRFITSIENQKLTLKALNLAELESLLSQWNPKVDWESTAIIVDCVLGLPQSISPKKVRPDIWKKIFEASQFQSPYGNYGRKPAEEFFLKFLPKKAEGFPKRVCEKWSKSNSVFQSRPFQKNIQTGTFRLWRDIGQAGKPWAKIWPYDLIEPSLRSKGPWLFEGYPSLIWQKYLSCRHRYPILLKRQATKKLKEFEVDDWEILTKCPDHADAFVLSWGAAYLEQCNQLWVPFSGFEEKMKKLQEGWILGLDPF